MEDFFLMLTTIIIFAGQLLGIWCIMEPLIKEKRNTTLILKLLEDFNLTDINNQIRLYTEGQTEAYFLKHEFELISCIKTIEERAKKCEILKEHIANLDNDAVKIRLNTSINEYLSCDIGVQHFNLNKLYELQTKLKLLKELKLEEWPTVLYDDKIIVKSRQALQNYDSIKYFKQTNSLMLAVEKIQSNAFRVAILNKYHKSNDYSFMLSDIVKLLKYYANYSILIQYISSAGNCLDTRFLYISVDEIYHLRDNPQALMTKAEYNKQQKEVIKTNFEERQRKYYERINAIVDEANNITETLVIKSQEITINDLITKLYNIVPNIDSLKINSSEERRGIAEKALAQIELTMNNIIAENNMLLDYYSSSDFKRIQVTCEEMMSAQYDFNQYITIKAAQISNLLGLRITRNETSVLNNYNYIRPYKKSLSPFIAEVSAQVFSSAENAPIDYVIKYFYSDKSKHIEQIQSLQSLLGELETLEEARQIIERQKETFKVYLTEVPSYILEKDTLGFYQRLGFARIDEAILTAEYKFSYTSAGLNVQKTFSVPMTKDNIVALIRKLETFSVKKEQRRLMTPKLRQQIKQRDNYTCCLCGNSIHKEPNLLLEVDHIIPIAKGGLTEESNLQTLCWKCNRSKGAKM